VLIIVCLICRAASADLFEDFQDGDYTNDPTWTGDSSFYSVTLDPISMTNYALRGTGTAAGHRKLETVFAEPVPWQDFSFSIELMSTVQSNFRPYIQFGNASFTQGYSWMQWEHIAYLYDRIVEPTSIPPGSGSVYGAAEQRNPYETNHDVGLDALARVLESLRVVQRSQPIRPTLRRAGR
jgi:hypothetical protein